MAGIGFQRKARAAFALALLAQALLGCQRLPAFLPAGHQEEQIRASGVIQAEEVAVTPELGGKVLAVLKKEGERVEAGEVVIRLDDATIVATMRQAEAALATARAELAEVEARPREEAIRVAEAALAQAMAAREGAKATWEVAQAILTEPQELLLQIEEARTQLALAEQKMEQARVELTRAENLRDRFPDPSGEHYVYGLLAQAAREAVAAAEAERDAARAALNSLLAMREKPLALQAEARKAEGAYRKAEAAVVVAEAALAAARAPARAEEIALYRARLAQAETALSVLRVQQAKQELRAPRSGLVTSLIVQPGEIAAPGAKVMTIADLSHVEVTIYVQEPDLGRVWLGQRAHVTVDAFPERIFEGRVVHIASKAEFTPKNVETPDERVQMVFAVKIALENPDLALKPGMPADAQLVP